MIHGYHEDNVHFVMRNFGKMFDIAIRQMGIGPDSFQKMLEESHVAKMIFDGDHRFLVGMSGTELLRSIMGDDSITDTDPLYPPGMEYWAGYVIAYVQWYWFRSFKEIFDAIPLSRIMELYHPYHEADLFKVNDIIGSRIIKENIIKRERKRRGITQRELSELSGISLATLRAYEQGELDICKAQAENVFVLSRIFDCSMEDLLKQ